MYSRDFGSLIGNDSVKQQLQLLLEKDRVPHLLLFSGIEGIGKRLFAKAFASLWLQKKLDGNFQPDLHLFSPEGKTGMHSIRSVRRLVEEISLSPYASKGKAVIVNDAERMLPTSANALLKALEEPPKNTLIILVSHQPEKLLGTIVSRSQQLRFCPCSDEEVALFLKEQRGDFRLASQARGSIGRAHRLLKEGPGEIETLLFGYLANTNKSFHQIAQCAKALQQVVEKRKKSLEAVLKQEYGGQSLKELSPAQRELIEQEMEGALSVAYLGDCFEIFSLIQSYYRDLVALSCNAPTLTTQQEMLETAYNQGQSIPLETVERLLREARQAIERSSPIQNILESLFLQLL